MKDQVRNNSLDAFRMIASIFVVFIHVPFPGIIGELIKTTGRFAVPFFLLISGYYYAEENAKKSIVSVIKLIIFSSALYCALNCMGSVLRRTGFFGWLVPHLTLEALLQFLLFNRAYFISNISYYLFMLLYVYIAMLLLARFGATQKCYALVPLLLAGTVLLTYLNVAWYYCGNWLMTGLPFFLLGKAIQTGKLKVSRPLPIIVLGLAAAVLEARLVRGDRYLGVSAIILSVGLFQWCLQNPAAFSGRFAAWGRRISLFVFILHCGIRDVLKNVLSINAWILPFVVLALSVVCSVLAYMLLNKIKNQIVRREKKASFGL